MVKASTTSPRSKPWALQGLLWGVMAFFAIIVGVTTIPYYMSLDPADSPITIWNENKIGHYASIIIHTFTGVTALVLGPFQFLTRLRTKRPMLHRTLGRIYLIAVVVGATSAITSALLSTSGFRIQVALMIVAVGWLYSAWRAYESIRRRDIAAHRIWMIRNYYFTFGAVTFRLVYYFGTYYFAGAIDTQFGGDRTNMEQQVYELAVWTPIAVNMIIGEWVILDRLRKPTRSN